MMRKRTLLTLFLTLLFGQTYAIEYVVGTPGGFASYNYQMTGGSGGTVVTVKNASELASALDTEAPMIILVEGVISISSELPCRSNKTIVGLGTNATIKGQGIALNKRENVIFQNIHFMQSGDDLIKLNGAQHIWVDHCSFSDGGADPSSSDFDGTLDICKGTDFVTVSYCHFFNHSKNILMSSSDGSGNTDTDKLRTTFHHCWFDKTFQRNPRMRFGIAHVYNCYYLDNSIYSVASCEKAKILLEDNYFEDCKHPAYAKSGYADSGPGYLWIRGTNIFNNSNETEFNAELNLPPADPAVPYDPQYYYSYTSLDANTIVTDIKANAGSGKLNGEPGGGEEPGGGGEEPGGGDPEQPADEKIIANWYPFQEATISLDFVSTNGTIDTKRAGNAPCSVGGVNLNDNTKKMTLTLQSLSTLKVRIEPTGTRTFKVTYGTTGTENTWSKKYSSGNYEVGLTSEIPALKSENPIVVNFINDQSSSGGFYIHDLYVAIVGVPSKCEIPVADKGAVVSEIYYDFSGRKIKDVHSGQLFIKKVVYENGECKTIKGIEN